MSPPFVQSFDKDGVKIQGCSFRYHENLNGASLLVLNQNKSVYQEATIDVIQIDRDVYQLDRREIDSFNDSGSYFQCKLLNVLVLVSFLDNKINAFFLSALKLRPFFIHIDHQ